MLRKLGQSPTSLLARKAFTGLTAFSMFNAAIFVFSLFLVDSRPVHAQIRVRDGDNLERLLEGTKQAKTIADIPAPFVEAIKKKYAASPQTQRETKFEPFLSAQYFRFWDVLDVRTRYKNVTMVMADKDMCEDGTFENGKLDTSVWDGYWTGGTPGQIVGGSIPVGTWNPGIVPANGIPNPVFDADCTLGKAPADHSKNSHHKVLPANTDLIVPGSVLKTVPGTPSTNGGSLMLGNPCVSFGGERVEKTFAVKPGQRSLSFWYAAVFENPDGHNASDQPGFGVTIYDTATGLPIPNPIDIDYATSGNQGFLVSDSNNVFFKTFTTPRGPAVYRDWTCVDIDLSGLEGKKLKLVLANRDCGQGGHFGYTYVDNICLGCKGSPTGSADFKASESKDCGPNGKVCFEYSVPKLAGSTVNISLQRFQSGIAVGAPLTSGSQTSDGTFCFAGSQLVAGMTGDFDWVATASFTAPGATISPKIIGTNPGQTGFVPGANNDYKIACKSCCGTGKNFVKNGDFRDVKGELGSDYKPSKALLPGNVFVGNQDSANKACANWKVSGHAAGKCADGGSDPFMMVNGLTTQTGPSVATVWSQQVSVDAEGEYEFCVFVKDLKQCCFNKNPQITLKATAGSKVTTQNAVVATSGKECDWQLVSTTVSVPPGVSTVNLQILLDQSVVGDGNDLAIDDISLSRKDPVAASYLTTNPQLTENSAGDKFTVMTTMPAPPSADCKTVWKAVEFKRDNLGKLIKDSNGDLVPDPATYKEWTNPPSPFNFFGYNGATPGIFDSAKLYRITYGVECDCQSYRSRSWRIGLEDSSTQFRTSQPRKPMIKEEMQVNNRK